MTYSRLNYNQVVAIRNLLKLLRWLRAASVIDVIVEGNEAKISVLANNEITYNAKFLNHQPGIYKTSEDLMWESFAELDAMGLAFDGPDSQATS